jgi:hypothetical protein
VYYWENTPEIPGEYVEPPIAPANTLTLGDGYWLENTQTASVTNNGIPVTASTYQIPLSHGWNMIGVPYDASIPMTSIMVTPAGSTTPVPYATALKSGAVSVFYTWQIGMDAYESLGSGTNDALTPWYGYWIESNTAGGATLTIANPGA